MAVRTFKVKAPVGGWNSRDPIASMGPDDAVAMDNCLVDTEGVTIRPGYTQYCQLMSVVAMTTKLIPWKTQYGERLLASAPNTASDHRLFDISTSTPATIKSGFMSSSWKHGLMNSRLALVNGADTPQQLTYTPGTGVVIQGLTISGPASVEALKVIHIFKSRSYFATGAEPSFWYSAVNSLGGVLTEFPIDRVAESSGNIIEISSWTRDGGSGPDDFFVLFLDTGEVLVYQGSNPGDANDWALVGRYRLGKVLTVTQFAGKIHAVTDQDYNILPDDLLTEGLQIPTKMSGAARDAVKRESSENWQILFDPVWGLRIVNVPYGSNREQHILSLRTGAPSRFTIPANCWARYKGDLYFGGAAAKVYKIREGDDNGAAISWSIIQAYSDFGTNHPKGVRNYRPMWHTYGSLTIQSGLMYDYESSEFFQELSTETTGPPWNTSPWNTTSWTVGHPVSKEWLVGAGYGQNVALIQRGSATEKATWHHTDYRIEVGSDAL